MKKILLILTALTVSAAAFAEKITTVAEITSGYKYYIGATTGGNDYYFYVDGSSKTESIKGVAKEDKAEAVALTFTAVTGGWTIKFDNGLYLGIKNAKDNGAVQVLDEAMVWTIEEDKGLLKLHPNDYYLQKNNSGTQFGSYKATQTNVWLESAGSAPVLATLDSLVIKGKAEKMEYELGEAFDPAGLEVWGIYTKTVKHDSTSIITKGLTWTLDPETFEEASDNASVTMVASFKELTTADTTITSIKVKQKVPKYTTYENWQIKYEGSDWVNMTKVEEGLFMLAEINWETRFGFNVKSDDNPIKKDWYDPDDPDVVIGEEVTPPIYADVYLRVIDDETLKIGIGVEPPIQFVDTASGLKFEITSMEEPRTVKVINNDYPGTSYTVPGTVTYWEKTFDVTEIGVEAFHDCSSLESITLPESVTTLAYSSLSTSGLKSITIPATVTTIGEYAFAGCSDLQSVTFQGNACQDTIGDNAFEDVGTTTTPATLTLPDDWAGSTPENSETPWYGGYFDYDAPVWPEDAPTEAPADPTVDGASILGAALTTSYAFEPQDWPGAMPQLLTFETGETIYYMEGMTWQIYTNWDEDSYDVSKYNTLHVDLYPATGTEIKITFECLSVDDGGQGYKNSVVKTLTAGQWNALDIALSEFPALTSGDPYDFSDIRYFILEGYDAEHTALTVGNVYFYSNPTALPKVDETGITVNGRKYGFPVRLVKEVK